MASPSDVAVVIPHFGDPAPTRALVRSLLAQHPSPPARIVIVDDASPEPFGPMDGSHRDDGRVRVIRRESNGGFGAAVNTGAASVGGEADGVDLLLVLNSDLTLGPDVLADLCAAATPWMPAVCSPAVLDASGAHAWAGRRWPTAAHQGVEWLTPLARFRPRLHEAVGHDTACLPGATVVTDWVIGAALLLPLAAFSAVGGFDERFHMNCEEIDLQRRLRARGIPSVFVGTVSVTHAGGGSSDPARRRAWLVESRRRYAAKWGGRSRLTLALGAATVVNLVANTARRVAGRPVAPLRTAREELALLTGARS